jgi:hypothetical protein
MEPLRTLIRDRSGSDFAIPVMTLPVERTPRPRGIVARELHDGVVEIVDEVMRARRVERSGGEVVRMETTVSGSTGTFERLDQRIGDRMWLSAFVEPGAAPRTVTWSGQLLVQPRTGLVNYIASNGERLYETSDGAIVYERPRPTGARVFAWLEWSGRVRSKQIHDAMGRRTFVSLRDGEIDRIRLPGGAQLVRDGRGVFWTDRDEAVRKIEILDEGSIRWVAGNVTRELRGDGSTVVRSDNRTGISFRRTSSRGAVECAIETTFDETGREKTLIRDGEGLKVVRISAPRTDGGHDRRTLERRGPTEAMTWQVSLASPPGKAPEDPLLPTLEDESGIVTGQVEIQGDSIVYRFADASGAYVEHSDGRILKLPA